MVFLLILLAPGCKTAGWKAIRLDDYKETDFDLYWQENRYEILDRIRSQDDIDYWNEVNDSYEKRREGIWLFESKWPN
ncbi:MAG: hypothetical protein A3K22_01585 [Deltaproteobacteria bacterium RBG_16_42_7]|nr:MAG: hypothetical protein A3K22_01585 [Deltaproteobacteria bacterium RBG_16_42_7]